jgi:hypothetical protein
MRVVMHMDLDEIIALNYYSSQLYMHGSSFGIYWIVKHAIAGAEQSNFCVNAITLSFRLKLCSSFVVTSYIHLIWFAQAQAFSNTVMGSFSWFHSTI